MNYCNNKESAATFRIESVEKLKHKKSIETDVIADGKVFFFAPTSFNMIFTHT